MDIILRVIKRDWNIFHYTGYDDSIFHSHSTCIFLMLTSTCWILLDHPHTCTAFPNHNSNFSLYLIEKCSFFFCFVIFNHTNLCPTTTGLIKTRNDWFVSIHSNFRDFSRKFDYLHFLLSRISSNKIIIKPNVIQ